MSDRISQTVLVLSRSWLTDKAWKPDGVGSGPKVAGGKVMYLVLYQRNQDFPRMERLLPNRRKENIYAFCLQSQEGNTSGCPVEVAQAL